MNNQVDGYLMGGEDLLVKKSDPIKDDLFSESGRGTVKGVETLNELFRQAVALGAADFYFQQTKNNCRVRFRMPGGSLRNITFIDKETMRVIDDKIRSRANIPLSERRTPQDGRMSLTVNGVHIDVRVAISPGVDDGGQLIVCRILNQSNASKKLADIEMPMSVREAFLNMLSEPNGLFLVTGPTGSGKTTTLYAMLNELNNESRNIITIENPVEYRNSDLHQMPVDGMHLTFANALRAALRQDPDIIMVGEIRDLETANIAVQAAITGHLVLSTLHTNSAPGAITRMLNYGVELGTLAAALRGVSAQRLVQTIAPHANVSRHAPNEAESIWLRATNVHRINPTYPRVCDVVHDYRGITPVMEVVMVDDRVRKAMANGEAAIFEAASRQPQFETLGQAGERLAFAGTTTLEQARKIASIQDAPNIQNKRIGQVLVELGKTDAADMESLLSAQAQSRIEGDYKRLGKMLVEGNFCTEDDVFEALGYTAEAQDILTRVCHTEDKKQGLFALLRRWTPGINSLFQIALEAELVTLEELQNV